MSRKIVTGGRSRMRNFGGVCEVGNRWDGWVVCKVGSPEDDCEALKACGYTLCTMVYKFTI